ncbi:hypothetical protein [Peribacillus simplex]|uniref:hypothetical protein n=1 Tax=Peribacillus simplex TaxID=1478 RepID=UPI003671394A
MKTTETEKEKETKIKVTVNKLEHFLDALESADKKELLYAISELSSSDVKNISKLAPIIRSAILDNMENQMNDVIKPVTVKDYNLALKYLSTPGIELNDSNPVLKYLNSQGIELKYYGDYKDYIAVDLNDFDDEQESISEEENKEIEEKYGERSKAPLSDFEEFKGPKQFYDLLMKDKKEKGWKFLDEK